MLVNVGYDWPRTVWFRAADVKHSHHYQLAAATIDHHSNKVHALTNIECSINCQLNK